MGTGDVITHTFSEPVTPTSVLAGWDGTSRTVSVTITNAGSNDTVTVVGVNLGTIATGGDYVGGNSTVGATMVMSGSTIRVTLTANPGSLKTVTSSTMVWTPSASVRDLAGNAMSTTPRTETGAPKQNF
jgi:archaellum component FlaF (FlaF/FlaG flagellin family)